MMRCKIQGLTGKCAKNGHHQNYDPYVLMNERRRDL